MVHRLLQPTFLLPPCLNNISHSSRYNSNTLHPPQWHGPLKLPQLGLQVLLSSPTFFR